MNEWKLNISDVAAFEHELRNFASHYVQDHYETGLESITLNEWQAPGSHLPTQHELNQVIDVFEGKIDAPHGLGSRPIDETGQPIDPVTGRSWSVVFKRISDDPPWLSLPDEGTRYREYTDNGARFTVYMNGGDYPMLFKVSDVMDTARPFVSAWIERCKALWDAVPVTSQQAQKSADKGKHSNAGARTFDEDLRLWHRVFEMKWDRRKAKEAWLKELTPERLGRSAEQKNASADNILKPGWIEKAGHRQKLSKLIKKGKAG